MLTDTTSEFRNKMCSLVVGHAWARRGQVAKDLACRLGTRPFEVLSDEELVDLALDMGVPENDISRVSSTTSFNRVRVDARHLCGTCFDKHVIRLEGDPVRFMQCPTCTARPMTDFNPNDPE